MSRDYPFKQASLKRTASIISQSDEHYRTSPKLQKFSSQMDDILNESEFRQMSLSRQMSYIYLCDPFIPLGSRRSISIQSNQSQLQKLQSQISQFNDAKQKQELKSKEINQDQSEQEEIGENKKKIKLQQGVKNLQIQKKLIKKTSEIEQQPCFCRNSGCLKRYCRCFHSGRMCLKDCKCVQGCLNNENNLESRNQAIKHVNEKCHRNKNMPKDALFKLKDCFGCNCKKSKCQTGYCECFLRKSKCTENCQCTKCENDLDKEQQENQGLRQKQRIKRK